ncbi:CBO0543 family protein [Bacillus sp. Marseille-Q1617]|uniref:CBO0543 family protein n=1 Tax=Bacillus sp. Marseille-Q1617 TaxID=2736887 RepID=UPI00158E82A8|nr:CBO0543 family protein [Bacillus sp. Marseille-Q1617]
MTIVFLLTYALAGWKFGNWKEFHSFYPTLLFFIIGDLLSQFLLFEYSMWKFHAADPFSQSLKLNHTIIALLKMMIQYTVTVAIFIGRLPETLPKRILWVLLWTGIYGTTEGLSFLLGMMTYHHGWHFGWDLVFNIMMLTMLVIHHKKPIYAWIASFPVIVGLWIIFDVPYSVLK